MFTAICLDVLILVMTVVGMRMRQLPSESQLWTALFTQGVGYALATSLTCIPAMVRTIL